MYRVIPQPFAQSPIGHGKRQHTVTTDADSVPPQPPASPVFNPSTLQISFARIPLPA